MRIKKMAPSDFYCTQCGKKGLVCYRVVGQERKSGHLKKLFCIYCGKDQNCVEIKANSTKYSFEDFLNEFNNHNFDENGNVHQRFAGLSIHYRGYQKHAVLQQNVEIVSLQFVLFEKATYVEVGGFEFSLSLEERAIHFCKQLQKNGYFIALNPDVVAKRIKR